MMKKLISLLLTVLMLFLTLPVSVINAKSYDDYGYNVLKDKSIEINSYSGDDKTVKIPSEIDGKTVTAIGESAFINLTSAKKVIIPDTVKKIGSDAFSCSASVEEFVIPESVFEIGDGAFSDCSSLKEITLPKNLTEIKNYLFYDCASLKTINVGNKLKCILPDAFFGTAFYNDETNWSDNVLYLKNYLIEASSLTGEYIVKNNTKLIASRAFAGCKNLTSVTVPESVKYINEAAFFNCRSLKSIKVSKDNKSFLSSKGVLYNKNKSKLIAYPSGLKAEEYSLPKSVKTVSNYAFMNSKLKKVVLDKNLKTVGDLAFFNCKKLKSVTVPKSVKKIGYEAFGYYESGEEFDLDFLIKGFELNGYQGSEAQKYCLKNEIAFVALDYSAPSVSVKGGNKKISVKYKKVKGAEGYQIKYGSKTTETKNLKKTIKLKKGTYKVKVRAYKIKDGKRVYGKWSKSFKVKVK